MAGERNEGMAPIAQVEWHPKIKDLPSSERPRERLLQFGAGSLSTTELLAIILRTGTRTGGTSHNVTRVAEDLVTSFKGLNGLARAAASDLCRQKGVGPAKAAQVKAALELARRLLKEQPEEAYQVRSPADVANLLRLEMSALEHEQFRVLLLDTKNRMIQDHKLYDGTVNTSLVRVAEVFREAVRQNAAAVVVVHNHPSGDPVPSREDIRLTTEIVRAGKLLDIDVLDHVVVATRGFISLREKGLGFDLGGASLDSQKEDLSMVAGRGRVSSPAILNGGRPKRT